MSSNMQYPSRQSSDEILAFILTNSDAVHRLLTTRIGDQPALNFGLQHSLSVKRPIQRIFLIPSDFHSSLQQRIVTAISAFNVKLLIGFEENILKDLHNLMVQEHLKSVALVPAEDIFVMGEILDTALLLLSRYSVDYIYGADYPHGCRPIVVSENIVSSCSQRLFDDLSWDVVSLLLNSLPAYQGIRFPAPSTIQHTEHNLSLRSDQSAARLEATAQHLIRNNKPLKPTYFVREFEKQSKAQIRAGFRVMQAHQGPQNRKVSRETSTSILCASFRSGKSSGAETSLANLLSGVDKSKFRLVLGLPSKEGAMAEVAVQHGAEINVVPALSRMVESFSAALPHALQLRKFARDHQVALVYSNHTNVSYLSALTALLLGCPYIGRVIEEIERPELEASLLTFANKIVVPSRFMADSCRELGIPSDRLRVVYEGVPEDWFKSISQSFDLRHACGFQENSLLIGVASRLDDPRKALERAVETMPFILAEQPDARMVICGTTGLGVTHLETKLRKRIRDLGLESYISLPGFFTDMRAIYPQFQMLLHPAVREPFGLVVTEAMAVGVPVVAVGDGGISEQIIDGESGLLVARNEPELLAQAALRILGDTDLTKQVGLAASHRIRTRFTAEQFVKGIEAVFEEVIYS